MDTAWTPVDRTQGAHPFQVVGVDYVGLIKFKKHGSGRQGVYCVVCMFSELCMVHGFGVLTGNPRVHSESQEADCKKRTPTENIFRPWFYI